MKSSEWRAKARLRVLDLYGGKTVTPAAVASALHLTKWLADNDFPEPTIAEAGNGGIAVHWNKELSIVLLSTGLCGSVTYPEAGPVDEYNPPVPLPNNPGGEP